MHLFGDNGVISNAQNANVKSGMVALEEWLQEKYVEYYDEADIYTNKPELLNAKIPELLLKDGSRNYIVNGGKIYYLINKSILPKEIKDGLVSGNSTEYAQYTRLIDVYGITTDLKVYYCDYTNTENPTIYGSINVNDIDPNQPVPSINNDAITKSVIVDALSTLGITIDEKLGVTVGNVSHIKDLNIDGKKYGLTSLKAFSELKNLKTLTVSDLTLSNLDGLEGCPNLYYLRLDNCLIEDYCKLATSLNLKYLYLYLSNTISEENANAQVTNLGDGLSSASRLNKLEYLGISGIKKIYENNSTWIYHTGNNGYYSMNYTSTGNLSDISGLSNFNDTIKSNLKYLFLNNNKITSVEPLGVNGNKKAYTNLNSITLFGNPKLPSLKGLENRTSLEKLAVQNSGLTSISGLTGCSGLKGLSVEFNSLLTSLAGLEDSNLLFQLYAKGCNLSDITGIKNCSNLTKLDISKNINLKNVITLGSCTSLNWLYLTDNINMIGIELKNALGNPETHILENCGLNYDMPYDYILNYFSDDVPELDYSYSNLGYYLTGDEDDDKFWGLQGRENLYKLSLEGQSQLKNDDLQTVLKTLSGMRGLNLRGCSNLSSVDFVNNKQMKNLEELDIRSTNSLLTDLSSIMNNCTIHTLMINNPNTDITKIQMLFENRVGSSYSWYNTYSFYISRIIFRWKSF